MDYGKDLKLDDDRDVVFTPDGDIETIEGAALVAQDIREELSIVLGSVAWDKTAGADLVDNLNAAVDPDKTVLAELERIALRDPRIDASTIATSKAADGRYALYYRVIGVMDETELLFDLKELMQGEE